MITPIFRLDQDDEYLYVYLTTPNLCLTDGEIFYEETDFLFYAKPYYLRLELPASVQPSQKAITDNDDKEKSLKYDTDKNELCVPVPKKNRGEHFTNLDMLTKLLTGPKTNASKKLVEVIDSGLEAVVDIDEDDDFDWNIEQELPTDEFTGSTLLGTEGYGFARRKTGIIEKIGIEAKEICDIKEPGKKSISERRELRILDEESKFSEDHYLADLYDTESIEPFLKSIAPWDNWHNKDIFTDDDRQRMIDRLKKVDLPKYDNTTRKSLLLSVVDILFAYAYDLRTNDFEHSVESAWTIRKLSPTLSWFEHWIRQKSKNSAQEVLSTCVRRSLVYPLYRNWLLALKIIEDVTAILSLGRNAVLKCFLDIHRLFNENGEYYYILNELFINDYCYWIQQLKDNQFVKLAKYLKQINLTKSDVDLDLCTLEQAAEMALQEQNKNDTKIDISEAMRNCLRISQPEQVDSDDDVEE